MRFELRRTSTLRARRFVLPVAIAGVALVAATGCQPNPVASISAQPTNAVTARLEVVNNSGVAVGFYNATGDSTPRVYEYEFSTSKSTDLSAIPPSTSFPSGATFSASDGVSVNSSGDVLASVAGSDVLYVSSTGTYTPVPCSGMFGMHALSDNGLVACGDSVYNTNTTSTVPVTSPSGCNGRVTQVNNDVAVGTCSAGTEPFFVTSLTTGTTAGFGASEGFYDPDYDGLGLNELTNGNWVVLADSVDGQNTSSIVNVAGASPVDVSIGGKSRISEPILAASDNGRVALSPDSGSCASGCGIVVVNPATGTMVGLDAPTAVASEMVALGLNDVGQIVGYSPPQAFAGTVSMP